MTLPPEITTVLFDMDGVLINTETAVDLAYRGWARRNGLNPDEVMAIVHGRRTVEVAIHFGLEEDAEDEADRIEKEIADRATAGNAIVPACELYKALDRHQVAVATSARRATALTNLRVLGLGQPEVLITGEDVENGKPAPDPYLEAARRMGVDPSECVVIEDAPAGIKAGKSAGAYVVALTTTHDAGDLAEADEVLAPRQLDEVFAALLAA